jgi:transposase
MVAANERTALTFSLSGGQAHDAPEGRALLDAWDKPLTGQSFTGQSFTGQSFTGQSFTGLPLLMDRAYEGDETRQLALDLGFTPVVPPKANRIAPWTYDRNLYKRRNEIERLFRRLKGYRRIFSRFDKLDIMFKAFLNFALIVDMIKC